MEVVIQQEQLTAPVATANQAGVRACARWTGKATITTAWLALALAIFSPVTGVGISLCWMRDTGVPCPGCGLTRSLSCALRGMLSESCAYHPFGPLLLVFFLVIALTSLAPRKWRADWESKLQSRPGLLDAIFVGCVVAFVGFGFARAILHLGGYCVFHV